MFEATVEFLIEFGTYLSSRIACTLLLLLFTGALVYPLIKLAS